ncbi:glycyl-radical enzyme activating protein [Lancefieldella parvula]|uniref:glycyl-radical enzyme activating protein n=1 Tax=Lancefieldella parvula TaxID=1382 RepID=UPI0028D4AA2D|nr:glycyl-radical enzyme activating protein [Lancefieldella parvula]
MCCKSDIITNIQRYSLHDGGGIRTVAFLKGCPFRCPWCCNPENLSFEQEISFHKSLCIGCSVRKDGRLDANGCPCDTPVSECPTGAKRFEGTEHNVDTLVDKLSRDKVFFDESDGGITLSGGECLAGSKRQEYVMDVLQGCKNRGINTALETTLAVPLVDVERLARACDVFLVDFKLADKDRSIEVTGIDTDIRDKNIRALVRLGATVIARVPLIPGYTASIVNAQSNAEAICAHKIKQVDLLPFHKLGEGKYESLGMRYECADSVLITEKELSDIENVYKSFGLKVVRYGE